MDIVAQIEELRQEIVSQRTQALEGWETGDIKVDALIQLSGDPEES